jgi:hypothetical protein
MKPVTPIPAAVLLAAAAMLHAAEPPTLPGTQRLAPHPDLSAAMVAGIDTLALERIERSPAGRRPTREKLAAALGMVDRRLPVAALEFVGDTATPALVSRGTEFSQGDRLRIRTNVPHREWIHRQCYQLGRHLVGYEVQQTLAVVDWFASRPQRVPVIVAGAGEGGLVALRAAALDDRIDGASCAGFFGPRDGVWQEPLDRNVFGLLRDFGAAEIASLVAPRPLVLHHALYPEHEVSRQAEPGVRAIAAPGRLTSPTRAAFDAEVARAEALAPTSRIRCLGAEPQLDAIIGHLLPAEAAARVRETETVAIYEVVLDVRDGDFNEWVRYCVSTDLPIPGSMHAGEYEIWEWNKAAFANGGDQLPASQATSMNHSLVTSGSEPAANAGPSSQPERPRQEPARLGCQTVSCPLPRPLEGNRERDRRR